MAMMDIEQALAALRTEGTLAEQCRQMCEAWTSTSADLTWLERYSVKRAELGATVELSHEFATVLQAAYAAAGIRNSRILADDFFTIIRTLQHNQGFGRVTPRPLGRLQLATALGALRGEICVLAEFLNAAGKANSSSSADSHSARGRITKKSIMRAATGLLAVGTFTASVSATDVVPNIESFLDVVFYWSGQLVGATQHMNFELANDLTSKLRFELGAAELGIGIKFEM